MLVDDLDQARDLLRGSRARNLGRERHVLKSRRNVGDAKEPAQVETSRRVHVDAIERNAEYTRIRRVDDLLAGAKRRENQFHRRWPRVRATDLVRLVDVQGELANLHPRPVLIDERRRRLEGGDRWLWRITKIGAHLPND
jgi:hypothetical protein